MASTRAKGSIAERQVKAILEKKSHAVMRAPYTMRPIGKGRFVSGQVDFFGLYDLVAKSSQSGNTFWIQVKSTDAHSSSAKKPIQEFHDVYCGQCDHSEIWQKVARKGFIVHYYDARKKNWVKTYFNFKGQKVEQWKKKKD